jgi:hypothetical protein
LKIDIDEEALKEEEENMSQEEKAKKQIPNAAEIFSREELARFQCHEEQMFLIFQLQKHHGVLTLGFGISAIE